MHVPLSMIMLDLALLKGVYTSGIEAVFRTISFEMFIGVTLLM